MIRIVKQGNSKPQKREIIEVKTETKEVKTEKKSKKTNSNTNE